MSIPANVPIDVLVCYEKERGTKYPHWMLMLVSQGGQRGTWYHSTGGPTQGTPYAVTIEANKRLDSHGIQSTEQIGTIMPKDVNKVKAAAQRVQPQQCQRYVVHLVHGLEKKDLARAGEAVRLNGKVQISERAQAYAVQNPVDHPSGAYVPPGGPVAGPSNSGRRVSPIRAPQQIQQGRRQNPQQRRQNQQPQQQQQRRPKESKGCCIMM